MWFTLKTKNILHTHKQQDEKKYIPQLKKKTKIKTEKPLVVFVDRRVFTDQQAQNTL